MTMTRRTLLRLAAVGGAGSAALPPWGIRLIESALAQAGAPAVPAAGWAPALLTPHQDQTVVALCELIIPQTDTAGATAAGVNRFVDAVVADADVTDRVVFLRGLDWIDRRTRELHGCDFVSATPEQQTALLSSISGAAQDAPPAAVAFFKSIKALTITGYYTSEIGMTQELGDDGRVMFAEYLGCTHPEHKRGA